jgi:hypothetical protein
MISARVRFTLAGLMGVVLLAAVECWLVRGLDLFDLLRVFPIVLPLFGVVAVQPRTRVFCLSFASFALAYALLSEFGPSFFVIKMFELVDVLTGVLLRENPPSRLAPPRWRPLVYVWAYRGVDSAICVLVSLFGAYVAQKVYVRHQRRRGASAQSH